MYQYIWDEETGGPLLTTEQSKFSKEPRPVYYRELDTLGFDKYWDYPKDDSAPLMWAEANNYIYRGRTVARTKGGAYYTRPEIIIMENPEEGNQPLRFVDIDGMVAKNAHLMESLEQESIQKVYNVYREYKDDIDVFYVAFSGGKDSIVALDIVQRALPHNDFLVLFGNTRMEFPDTYNMVMEIQKICNKLGIRFYEAASKFLPEDTWRCFGPPSTTSRWCCSVHKTSPQINLLRKLVGKRDFKGMAFTGVRAEESISRSNYDSINDGRKHSGQMSFHTILDWTSAELYIYIYSRKLLLNEGYKKGNVRVGCLVCPNSTGKHEYIKRSAYAEQVDLFLNIIAETSGKTAYSKEDMKDFINAGYWRTRKSGRELNFGYDRFEIITGSTPPMIDVFSINLKWQNWAKTIGDLTQISDELYTVHFQEKKYNIKVDIGENKTRFIFENCEHTKVDIKFQSLMRSVIIKSLYCIGCGECEAECKYGCIDMSNGISIGDNCKHCFRCHNVREHCLRYASIRNKITEGKKMAGLDRYFTFGVREEWLESFIKHKGSSEFWLSDGDGQVPNKKKDAFKNFADDAGLTIYDKTADGDKYTKCIPTPFAKKIIQEGASSSISWALILCNLVYTPAYNWFVNNLEFGISYTPDSLNLMLSDVMENDTKGKGKRNVIDALKIIMAKTPLGKNEIFAFCDINEKISASGRETITMNAIERVTWKEPDAKVILYSLYKFAEKCGDYHQFSLSELLDDSIEREGISPTKIFGLDYDAMVPLLNGLAVNYPDYISVSFSLGLDTINLQADKTAEDVLDLF